MTQKSHKPPAGKWMANCWQIFIECQQNNIITNFLHLKCWFSILIVIFMLLYFFTAFLFTSHRFTNWYKALPQLCGRFWTQKEALGTTLYNTFVNALQYWYPYEFASPTLLFDGVALSNRSFIFTFKHCIRVQQISCWQCWKWKLPQPDK